MLLKGNSIFAKVLLAAALPAVMASCSFKKDPESQRPKVIVVQQQAAPEAPERSLEQIIAEDSDEAIIESLDKKISRERYSSISNLCSRGEVLDEAN